MFRRSADECFDVCEKHDLMFHFHTSPGGSSDINNFIPYFTRIWLYLSPIIWPLSFLESENASSFAMLPLSLVTAADGYLARLRERGYVVEPP